MLVGRTKGLRSEPAWRQAYRSLEHGKARQQCERKKHIAKFPSEVEDFASLFSQVQRLRHLADYDPDALFSRSEVLQWLNDSREGIHDFNRVPGKDLRAFAVYLLFPMRE